MALAETANLAVKLTLGGNFLSQMGKVNKTLGTFDKNTSRAYRAGTQIGTGIKRGAAIAAAGAGLLASQVALGLDSLIELEQAQAQTEAVIKSTGGAAKVTAGQVRTLAEKYEALNATVGDEVIQSGENLLLTFTNIRKEGFEPALQAALDMNTALGKGPDGLTSTVRIVGKALQNPTKGLTALQRVGITFSDKQKKRIAQLQKEGKLYEAQGVILAELNKRFGGSFLAQGGTTAGKVAKFTDSIEDLQRALATALLPAIGNIADALTEFLSDPKTIKDVENLGKEIAKLFSRDNISKGIQLLKDAVGTIRSIAGPIASIVGGAVKAFTSLPPDIQKLLVGGFAVNKLTGGLVSNIAGGIFGALKSMVVTAGVVNVTGGVVNGGGGPGGPLLGGGSEGGGIIGLIRSALKGFILTAITLAAADLVASGIGDINAPNHQIPNGGKNRYGGTTMRGTNVPSEQLRNIDASIDQLRDRTDAVGKAQLAKLIALREGIINAPKPGNDSLKDLKREQAETRRITAQKLAEVKAAQVETKRETTKGAALMASAVRNTPPPKVMVKVEVDVAATNVVKRYTTIRRYGPTGGSRDNDQNHGSGPLR